MGVFSHACGHPFIKAAGCTAASVHVDGRRLPANRFNIWAERKDPGIRLVLPGLCLLCCDTFIAVAPPVGANLPGMLQRRSLFLGTYCDLPRPVRDHSGFSSVEGP